MSGAVDSSDDKEIMIPTSYSNENETHWDKIINSFRKLGNLIQRIIIYKK